MPSPGWTTKPCQGCGSTKPHHKDKLCHDCQGIYEDGLLARKKQAEPQDRIMVMHEARSHAISGPYLFTNSGDFFNSQLCDKLRHAWACLTMAVCEQAVGRGRPAVPYLIVNKKDTWGIDNDFHGYYDDEYFLVLPRVRDCLNSLDWAIRLALKYAYLAGRQQGLNLLARLNEGIVSLSDYEQKIKDAEKDQAELKRQAERIADITERM